MAATSVLTSVLPSALVEESVPAKVETSQESIAALPGITGGKCVKAGVFRTVKNVKYQCKKSAQGLRWATVAAKTATKTTPKTTTTTVPLTCATGGSCVVGDKGPGGGIVFFVNSDNKYSGFLYLEIAPTKTGNKVSFDDAVDEASRYQTPTADDWFLPNVEQAQLAIENLWFRPETPYIWKDCTTTNMGLWWDQDKAPLDGKPDGFCPGFWASDARESKTSGPIKGDFAYNFWLANWFKLVGTDNGHRCDVSLKVDDPCYRISRFKKPYIFEKSQPKNISGTSANFGFREGLIDVHPVRAFSPKNYSTNTETTVPTTSTIPAASTTTTTSPVPLYLDPEITKVNSLLNVQQCLIRDATFTERSSVSSGFPRPYFLRGGFGQLEVLVIPVGFSDLPFTQKDAKAMETAYEKTHSFFSAMSYGRAAVKMTLAPSSSWVDYGTTVAQAGIKNTPPQWDGSNFYRTIIEIYSRNNTISGYDVVDVVTAFATDFAGGQAMQSGSNNIYGTRKSFAGTQLFGASTQNWGIIAHELGHAWLGFEDLYLFKGGNPLGKWDMMAQAGTEFGGWSRFLAGWIDPNQVRCASPRSPSKHYLASLNADKNEDKPRILVTPLSDQSAIIAELRTPGTWQTDVKKPTLIVYRVETGVDHGNGPITFVGATDQNGGTISTDGVKFTVKAINTSGVIVDVGN